MAIQEENVRFPRWKRLRKRRRNAVYCLIRSVASRSRLGEGKGFPTRVFFLLLPPDKEHLAHHFSTETPIVSLQNYVPPKLRRTTRNCLAHQWLGTPGLGYVCVCLTHLSDGPVGGPFETFGIPIFFPTYVSTVDVRFRHDSKFSQVDFWHLFRISKVKNFIPFNPLVFDK